MERGWFRALSVPPGTLGPVPSMNELVRQHTALDDSDLEWLHLLVSEWQLLSDLSFADLVLWVPTRDGTRYVSVAQMRPNTGPTSYQDDMVGHLVPRGRRPMLDAALDEGRIVREGDPEWREEVPVRVESIPVRRQGRVSPATPTCSRCVRRAGWSSPTCRAPPTSPR